MKHSVCQPVLFRMVLIALLWAIQHGLRQNPAMSEEATTAWNSSKLRDIEKEWQALQDARDKTPAKIPGESGKDKYAQTQSMVERLLRKRLSEQDLHQLAASCDTLPVRVKEWGFTRDVLAVMVEYFAELGDRESLVRLLSMRCPNRIAWPTNIEYYLASEGRRLKAPVLVLGEAYLKSKVPEARHVLASAMRRSFAGLGIRGKDDADYVKNAIEWYKKEKDHLVVNEKYTMNESASRFSVERYERSPELYDDPNGFKRYPLFEEKPVSTVGPSRNEETGQAGPKPVDDGLARVCSGSADARTSERELAKLQGTWEITEVMSEGRPVPEDNIKELRFVFRKETATVIIPDGENEESRVRLNPQQSPREMDLLRMTQSALKREETTALIYELQEVTTLAIYQLKGDSLRICFSRPDVWQRPTSFDTQKDSHETLLTLKRVKK